MEVLAFCLSSVTVLSSHVFVRSDPKRPVYTRAFCPLQPAIALAPINCTQTPAPPPPQTEVPLSPKPEPQAPEEAEPGEEKAQDPAPQEQPPTEKDEEEDKNN